MGVDCDPREGCLVVSLSAAQSALELLGPVKCCREGLFLCLNVDEILLRNPVGSASPMPWLPPSPGSFLPVRSCFGDPWAAVGAPGNLLGRREVGSLCPPSRILSPVRNEAVLLLLWWKPGVSGEAALGFTKPSKMLILSFRGEEGTLGSRRFVLGSGEQNREPLEKLSSGELVSAAVGCLATASRSARSSLDSAICRFRTKPERPRSKAFLSSVTLPFRCGFGPTGSSGGVGGFGVPSRWCGSVGKRLSRLGSATSSKAGLTNALGDSCLRGRDFEQSSAGCSSRTPIDGQTFISALSSTGRGRVDFSAGLVLTADACSWLVSWTPSF